MNLPFFRRPRKIAAVSGDRLGRLRKVLSKAQVSFRKEDPEAALNHIEPRVFSSHLPLIAEQELAFPIEATQRIAVFMEGFRIPAWAKKFSAKDDYAIRSYSPQGLVGLVEELKTIATWTEPLTLEDAVVAVTPFNDVSPVSMEDRDCFWRAFGTPVFEHLQAWDGTVIARECEVHDGLHVVPETAIFQVVQGEFVVTQLNRLDVPIVRAKTGVQGQLVREHCECGLETPRLQNLCAAVSDDISVAA